MTNSKGECVCVNIFYYFLLLYILKIIINIHKK